MRTWHRLVVGGAFAAPALLVGCNAILGLGDYKVGSEDGGTTSDVDVPETGGEDADVDAFVGECTTNIECTDRFTALGPVPIDASPPDGSDAASFDAGTFGALDGGTVPGVCVKPEYKCERVLSQDCKTLYGDWRNDDAIHLATLFSTSGAQGATNLPRQQAALMAAEEINSIAQGVPAADGGVRPLVVLSCDEANARRAAEHLVHDLHVPGVVGPNLSQNTIDLTQQVTAAGGTVLITPTGVASSIGDLQDNNLTWRAVPNDLVRAPLMINQINAIENEMKAGTIARARTINNDLKISIVYRNDALGQATFTSLTQNLQINGQPLSASANSAFKSIKPYNPASFDTTIPTDTATFAPDIVALIGTAESITRVMVPMEAATTWPSADRPYYVLIDSNRVQELLNAAQASDSLRVRVRGTGLGNPPGSQTESVYNAFSLAYSVRYGSTPDISGLGPSYDAMYALAFALSATADQPVSGAAIAQGLPKLAGGSTTIEVGKQRVLAAFSELRQGHSIRAIGTFNALEWDIKGDIKQGTIEVWCIGKPGGTAAFGHSGVYYATGGTVSGTYAQCPP